MMLVTRREKRKRARQRGEHPIDRMHRIETAHIPRHVKWKRGILFMWPTHAINPSSVTVWRFYVAPYTPDAYEGPRDVPYIMVGP